MNEQRLLDVGLGSLGLVLAAPICAAAAVATRLSGDRGPIFYRARRVGEHGRIITVLKLRTMRASATGPGVTGSDDPRITPVGRLLRRFKIDELPQLWNVVRGQMSLVGPRPEDPRYVDWSDPRHRRVFSARPGITGLAQLSYANEAALLAGDDPEERYRREILPAKLKLDEEYLERRSLRLDLWILARTALAVFGTPDTAARS